VTVRAVWQPGDFVDKVQKILGEEITILGLVVGGLIDGGE